MEILNYKDYTTQKSNKYRVMIYGSPGTGKTTLATSLFTGKTLLIDTEDGARYLQNDTEQLGVYSLTNWDDFVHELRSDSFQEAAAQYDTIVIDTIMQLQDAIAKSKMLTSQSAYTQSDGTLSLKGYGYLKSLVMKFMNILYNTEKNIVIVAHQTSKEQVVKGDDVKDMIIQPAILGGALNEIVARCDIVGRMTAKTISKGKTKKQEVQRYVKIAPGDTTFISKDRPGLFKDYETLIPTQDFIKELNDD